MLLVLFSWQMTVNPHYFSCRIFRCSLPCNCDLSVISDELGDLTFPMSNVALSVHWTSSFQPHVLAPIEWCCLGSLKLAVMAVFSVRKLASATDQSFGFFLRKLVVNYFLAHYWFESKKQKNKQRKNDDSWITLILKHMRAVCAHTRAPMHVQIEMVRNYL